MPDDRNESTPKIRKDRGGSPPAVTTILGIGASGATPGSLEQVLAGLTLDSGMAAILALQAREALDEGAFRRALGPRAEILRPVADGETVVAGHIYLPPADVIVMLEDGRFRTHQAPQNPGARGTIDSFFVSLAQDREDRAVGLVLAGTGADGTLGLVAIKEGGGLTVAEESEEVRAVDLAASSSPAAIADLILPAEQIAPRIALYIRHFARRAEAAALDAQAAEAADLLARIAAILRNKTGHDFHGYKQNTFLRRVQRRMQVLQADSIPAYIERLQSQPDEPLQLFNDLLIGVTQFFRDRREFELIEQRIVPELFEGKGRGGQLRIWVIGCSTGEEAYSLAMLLREEAARRGEVPQIQIFASDLDGRALAIARAGRYPETIARDMPPERLARWFVKEGNTYCVVKELREICIFSQHSVLKDAPFSRLDMISCRNLLIYLNGDLQNRLIPLFHFALRAGGYLFLGNSENISQHTKLFAPVDRAFRIFQRLETGVRLLPEFPFTPTDRRTAEAVPVPRPRALGEGLARRAERLAERYAPAYAIVDERFDVLHFSARMGRFIHPASGSASLSLLNLVHADLRLDVRGALSRAAAERRVVEVNGLRMGSNGHAALVDLVVQPVQDGPEAPANFIILFKDGAAVAEGAPAAPSASVVRDEHVQRLESELRVTRERLQATIEELESTNEELKSSNEEYQSLNEELQSANEELETSKEELQSVNEELTTVNGELAHRVQELGRANSDVKNLLESTQIATVFLDSDLRVMNFTPAVSEIFHLIETDIGRLIAHIKPRVLYDDLQDDVRRVIRTLGSVEREIENPGNATRYMVRVLPYRSVDNFIAGAVMTFTDVTPLTRAQRALRESEERFRALAELSPDGILTVVDGVVAYANPSAVRLLGARTAAELCGRSPLDLVQPGFREAVGEHLASVAKGEAAPPHEVGYARPDGSAIVLDTAAGAVPWQGRPAVQVLLRDVTERRGAEERQRMLLAELQHRVRNTMAMVRSIVRRTAANSGTVAEFAERLDGRIEAFARTQAMVTRTADQGVALCDLVREELAGHAGTDAAQFAVEGPPVRLRPRATQMIGLAIHELATNAAKYGALATPDGRITVRWSVDGADGAARLRLTWQESRVTRPPDGERRPGFGSELIERVLAYELGARTRLDFGPDGARCTIDLPLNGKMALPAEEDSGG